MSCQRRGAEMALVQLSQHFKESLFEAVPNLWTHIHSPLTEPPKVPASVEEGVIMGVYVDRVVVGCVCMCACACVMVK